MTWADWEPAISRYPVAGPWITDLEQRYVAEAVRDGWYEHAGVWPARFESGFAAAVGRRHAFSLPSCTAGLHLALAALGVGPGDEVIVPEVTWIASSAPISYVGATPVFADIDPVTWCLSPASVEAAITERTKAIIVVDLYGATPDWAALSAVAARAGVWLIEDAAEAIGSTWRGAPAGSFGVASAFSFHGSKTLTTGEGGMLLVDDDALAARIAVLRDHGRSPGDKRFLNDEVAFKYKMSPVQAALGAAQLERLPELVAKKREVFGWYADRLAGLEGVGLNVEPEGLFHSYWMVTLHVPGVDKWALAEQLSDLGIDSRPFFEPLSQLPAYAAMPTAAAARAVNTVAQAISPYAINLPSALRLDEDDVDQICAGVVKSLQRQAALSRSAS